jgi:hypothetical protein
LWKESLNSDGQQFTSPISTCVPVIETKIKFTVHYGSKVPTVTITVFKYRNKIGKIVVKAVPYSVK